MHLHEKLLKNCGKMNVTKKSETTSEKISENNNLIRLGSRGLFIKRRTAITRRKEPSVLIFLDQFSCNFRSTENKSRDMKI
jgi:hypothetical protein